MILKNCIIIFLNPKTIELFLVPFNKKFWNDLIDISFILPSSQQTNEMCLFVFCDLEDCVVLTDFKRTYCNYEAAALLLLILIYLNVRSKLSLLFPAKQFDFEMPSIELVQPSIERLQNRFFNKRFNGKQGEKRIKVK